jgi:hypothetical protein
MASRSYEIVRAYRTLYRSGLHAVQYSKPSRYTLRDTLRRTFREGDAADFNVQQITNTVKFLDNAARSKGTEHKVVKNLLFARWWQRSTACHPSTRLYAHDA